ncbi:MAG: hypothetical protein M3Q50_05415 [Chloroflexota bacterium]|nr:hypothetical protein [Chloroflexota bacterium]
MLHYIGSTKKPFASTRRAEMARITIREFSIGERAADKFWTHGITRRQVEEVLLNRMVVTINRRNRAAGHLAIGRDNNGRCIVIPVVVTEDPTVWRPITAWYCKPGEAAKLRKGKKET